MNDGDFVVTFHTTHDALSTERWFHRHERTVRIVPTPRTISSECGFSLWIRGADAEGVPALVGREKLRIEALYRVAGGDRERRYEVMAIVTERKESAE